MIWRYSVKRNGLRFLSMYSTTLIYVKGEDSMLFYWQSEVEQTIKFRGADNCGTHGFVKIFIQNIILNNVLKKLHLYKKIKLLHSDKEPDADQG